MKGRPEFLACGKPARLIPSVADTNKEERATSILLSALVSVHEFRQVMLQSLGIRVGTRAKLDAWTEIVFLNAGKNKESKERPDGLLILNTGKKSWKAIVEAKTGNEKIGEEQLTCYLKAAKEQACDAVITITNQFTAMPDHHPVKLPKKQTKAVDLFHWSWTYAITQAELLLQSDGIEDPDQRFILNEVVEYFNDGNSGMSGFTSMNSEWKDVVQKSFKNSSLNKGSDEIINTISSWHQEQRELCLKMWTLIGERVELKLPRSHKKDPQKRVADDCEKLATEHKLTATLAIPNAASDLEITADLTRRSITCSMKLEAPKDKVRSSARVNWLLKQIPASLESEFHIRACRAGRAPDTDKPIAEVRSNPELLEPENSSAPPISFEVFYSLDLAGKFQGNRVFIEQLEAAVPHFYEQIGQYLRAWVAPPPKMKKKEEDSSLEEPNEEFIGESVNQVW